VYGESERKAQRAMTAAEQLLRGLAAADRSCLDSVLAVPVTGSRTPAGAPCTTAGLDGDARALVRLAALLAVEGPTPSVCWAAELALVTGVGDDVLIAVLLAVRSCAQTAQMELTASSLAAALDDH
jgi:hypothetical protein